MFDQPEFAVNAIAIGIGALAPEPCTLVIGEFVTIDLLTGAVTYGEGYDPDEAARTFWEAIGHWRNVGLVIE